MTLQRLQKILASAGAGSRRACEELISAGRVRVNDRVVTLGDKADPASDRISLDGEPIHVDARVYIMLNKPRGVVSSLKPQGERSTVRDLVDVAERIYPVGRLDLDSEGLILMTNDGDLAQQITHPRFGPEKEYEVVVDGYPKEAQLQIWRRGVVLDDGKRTAPVKVHLKRKAASGTSLQVVMREGKKRQIRRIAETLGFRVKRLRRTRIGSLRLSKLALGEWRHLSAAEIQKLKQKPPRRSHSRQTKRRRR